ncbi:Pericentrin-AKAP-450 domain of centrosomal targeting protein [Popillia japonica]|uniref:Pericentrin-AKAP-450 domain of centrosomal targeting protein n=1 Tax=Popillia japonica TaxID=7064 RepID=A0AAW1KKU7_POPJA
MVDNLKKTNALLRHLLSELLVHFTRCEDELNRTLVDEIAKYDADKPALLNDSTSSNNSTDDVGANVTKRVHFAPNFSDLLNIVDSTANASGGFDSRDISVDLKNELGSCLERLKSDANAILALTANVRNNAVVVDNNGRLAFHHGTDVAELEEKLSSLTRQLIVDSQVKNDLVAELEEARNFVRNLESERVSLGNHVEELLSKQQVLEKDLLEANKKITDLIEFSHKEVISEGYGQDHRNSSLGGKIGNLADLQERARMLVAEWKNGADHPLIQLVEELCREGERITDEAKKDKEDLRQQIEAADRKLRATCCFLEEQAMEREMERDESQKEIAALKEQLKEKDKDKETCELVTKEVEQLELQMREMTKLIETSEQKRDEAENERKEAVEKIWVLREIIRDLESQVETKNAVEDELRKLVVELEDVIKQQTSTVDGLNRQLEGCKGGEGDDVHLLKERIVYLENEAQKLRLNNELVGSEGALREIQLQLNQFESSIERKTKDLEGLHSAISTTSCSSPSEDMSIRDQIRPHTPTVLGECDVPLQQLARLKEKLVKHSRAEDAAVKRIRDLEMQLTSTKHELEETQNEKEILQNQVTEQIVLLSSLQMRLDEQRLKAEHNQRQANSSLEIRIYDLETEVQALKETVHCKEKTIKQLNKIVEQTKERLEDREKELSAKEEDATILKLQAEIGKLTEENRLLKSKIDSDAQNAQILPNLVDNIIADKNSDIENLRRQLLDVQKQFDEYQSLNLDLDQLKQLSQMVSSDRALSDILSLLNLSEASVAEQVRKADQPTVDSLESPADLAAYNRNTNETVFLGSRKDFFIPEISTIEKEGPLNVDYTVDGVPLIKPNSTEIIHKSGANLELERLKTELAEKDDIIREYMEKLEVLQELEKDIDQLRKNLRTTEDDLKKARETFESEKSTDEDVKKNLRIELAEKKMHLTEKERQLELSEQDNARKEQMYMGLAREKREIELKLNEARQDVEHYKNFDAIINEKNMEVYHLEEQLAKLVESCVALEDLQLKVHTKDGQLEQIKAKYKELEDELMKKNQEFESLQVRYRTQSEDNQKLKKELKNTSEQLDSLTLELNATKSELKVKMEQLAGLEMTVTANCNHDEEIKRLKSLLVDRECELEILNEDLTRYQNDLSKLEEEIKRKQSGGGEFELESIKLQKQIAERDLEILKLRTVHDDLNKEIQHLHDHLQEKDKIIEQMKADTKSLHVNLETIQNKIQETGNIVDLRKRLQDEQHLNAILREEINGLRNPQDSIGKKERSFSIEDITGQVRRQLDYSAHLDSNILQALSSGDELNADADSIKDQQPSLNDFERLRTELEQKLNYEREQNQQLRNQLEKEKTLSTTIQIEDANLIEQMRIRLEEALDGEKQLEKSLERERKQRIDLENQVVALNQKMKTNVSTSSNSKTEVTEYKSLPNLDTHEVIRLREELGCLRDQNEQLLVDLKLLKRAKNELEANLKYAKDMLQLRTDEIEKTEAKFDSMRTNEIALKEELVRCQIELEQKLREVENSRELMGDLEKERHDMKRRINSLSDKLTTVEEEKRIERLVHQQKEAGLSSTVPERFLNKMKELTTSLKEQTDENKVLMETLSKMTMERSGLLERIRSLEDRNNYKVPFDDPISRANHLFGKYLRSESYRKALIWQKRYLVALLATYQDFRPIAERIPSSIFEPKQYKTPARSRGKRRFKCGAIVVIAIVRMKYMVQRWHSGRRMAAYSQQQSQNRNRTTTTTTTLADTQNNNAPSTQFQVGQPVSSQNFHSPLQEPQYGGGTFSRSPIHLLGQTTEHHVDTVHDRRSRDSPRIAGRNNVEESTAWSGVTPPQKERLRTVTSTVNIAPHSDHHLAPLETPNVMSFFKRFNEIQQRLGMTFDNLNS